MKRISDNNLLEHFIAKHNIKNIFLEEILQYAQLHFFQKDEYILEAETNLKYYYLLVEGNIKVYYLFENGKSMFLKFYKELISIGDLELLKDIPILCNIIAIEDTYLIGIPSDILRKKYLNNLSSAK